MNEDLHDVFRKLMEEQFEARTSDLVNSNQPSDEDKARVAKLRTAFRELVRDLPAGVSLDVERLMPAFAKRNMDTRANFQQTLFRLAVDCLRECELAFAQHRKANRPETPQPEPQGAMGE